jgi:DNA mismatch endonuclease (patch repair protein)
MQSVGTRDTGPELVVRQLLHRLGYRFRLHRRDLPGSPDIVFASRRKVIFVHGCYWHGHGCSKGRLPKSRLNYWRPKIEANKERDSRRQAELRTLGWESLVVWQCETAHAVPLCARLIRYLGNCGGSARPRTMSNKRKLGS